jgi:hypothetical protein
MHLFLWFHPKHKHVISDDCYKKLPQQKQNEYRKITDRQPTHYVESVERTSNDDDGILFTALATAAVVSMLDNDSPSFVGGSYTQPDPTPDFGGGDSGGASGDWSSSSDSSFSSSDSGGGW